ASKKGVKLQYKILQGHVGDALTDFAKSKDHKMNVIVIGGRGMSKIEVLLGSVTNYVLHKSQIPVLVVK
ncbi:MAG: universal stress protein, partial [Thaumarchaeota archaeon]|nr:universal stress protein [Nitrososphaerota archaeon]